ncbi:hypothetical protein, partial [Candidatus Magnetobacterium casense]
DLPAGGGKIVVFGGTYDFDVNVTRAIGNVIWEGVGYASYISRDGVNACITAGGSNWVFQDIRFDAGGVSGGQLIGCWIGSEHYAIDMVKTGGYDVVITKDANSEYYTAKSSDGTIYTSGNSAYTVIQSTLNSLVTSGVGTHSASCIRGKRILLREDGNQTSWESAWSLGTSQIQVPPLQNTVFDTRGVHIGTSGTSAFKFDSTMDSSINLGVVTSTTKSPILIKPTHAGPDGLTIFTINDFMVSSAVVLTAQSGSSACIELDPDNGDIIYNTFTANDIHNGDYGVYIQNDAANGVYGNTFNIPRIKGCDVAIRDGDPGCTNHYGNEWNVYIGSADEIGIAAYGGTNVWNVRCADGIAVAGEALHFYSGANDNQVTLNGFAEAIGYTDDGILNRFYGRNLDVSDYRGTFKDLAYSGTREAFYPCTFGDPDFIAYDVIPGALINAEGENGYIVVAVPDDFTSLVSAKIVWMPIAAAGTTMITSVSTVYGSSGQGYNTHAASGTMSRVNVQTNYWYEDNISSTLSSLAANDCIGIRAARPIGSVANTQAMIYGLRLTYVFTRP